jgi:uncharacterized protein YjbI with pentapeptide repeats
VLAFDRETGDMLEQLVLRPELSAFEAALRERLAIVAGLEDERFPRPRGIERGADDRLTVVSESVTGRRLSDLLDAAAEHGIIAGLDAGLGLLLELLPALSRLHDAGLAHGVLAPGRLMITPAGQLVLLDSIYADPLERLKLTRRRLWSEFRLAFPPSGGVARCNNTADLGHASMVAAALSVGRPLRDDDYPDGIGALRQEIHEIASIRGSKAFADAVDKFFGATLPLAGRRSTTSADEAAIDLRKLVRKELGITTCRTALLEFCQQVEAAEAEQMVTDAAEQEARAEAEAERRAELQAAEAARLEAEAEQAERVARERAEADRVARDRAEAERLEQERAEKARLEAERLEREHAEHAQLEAERLERERAETARLEAERVERERVEKARLEGEQIARERAEAERVARDRAEAERLEQERAEKARLEAERLEKERAEKARLEAERLERERAEAARLEAERLERERVEQARLEAERLARERAEQARLEAERLERERAEAARLEAERLERERLEAEQRERARLEAERLDLERAEKARRLEQQRLETERLERERLDAARLEAERIEKARLEAERLERERLEAARLEAERIEKARLEAERLERERLEAARLEAERIEKARLEAERLERKRIEAERLERERAEKARLEAERVEQERVEKARLKAERLERERAEKARIEAERLERERVEKARLEAERLERERLETERRERVARERAEKARIELERAEKARLEAERLASERSDAERREAELLEAARAERERGKKARLDAERLEKERAEHARLEAERQEQEEARERAERARIEAERLAAEQQERDRTREREEAAARARAKAKDEAPQDEGDTDASSEGWLVPPNHAAKFEQPVREASPPVAATPRAYPIYVPPAESDAWTTDRPPTARPVPTVEPVAAISAAAPASVTMTTSSTGTGPIRLKDDSRGPSFSMRSRAESRQEPDDDNLSAAGGYEPFEAETPARTVPWKLVAAGVLLIGGAIAITRGYLPASTPIIETVRKAVPSPAPAAPVTPPLTGNVGRLTITTEPAGAHVAIDGKPAGQTPLTLDTISPGRHVIAVTGASGATAKRTVRVEAGRTVTLDLPLFSGFAAISAPFVIEISENGKGLGTSEEQVLLSPGRHDLRLSNKDLGYVATETVEIQAGEVTRVSVDPRGRANINAAPWAEVWIDGEKAGETPLANVAVRLGVREIVFKNPQYGERKVVATITAGAPATVSVDFIK